MQLIAKPIKNTIEKNLKKAVEGHEVCLATILVGNNPDSEVYVRMKGNACKRCGIESRKIHLSEETTTEELLDVIYELNADDQIHGILLQHPVPKQIDEQRCFNAIDIRKDVDGVNTESYGRMAMGLDSFVSATPKGIMRLIQEYMIETTGKHAVVIGRSAILGKPIAALLLNANCTVTICHSKTVDLPSIVKQADIIVAAVGIPKFVKKEWIKEDAVVIDAGYNEGNVGDVDLDDIESVTSTYTPVPGGVGPMTIASLMEQTVEGYFKYFNDKREVNDKFEELKVALSSHWTFDEIDGNEIRFTSKFDDMEVLTVDEEGQFYCQYFYDDMDTILTHTVDIKTMNVIRSVFGY